MKRNTTSGNELDGSLILVPQSFLDELKEQQGKIISLLEKERPNSIPGDYILEKEAQDLLGRRTTWFWHMRNTGQLAYTKVGNRIFYAKADIQRLLDNHRQEGAAQSAKENR